MGYQTKVRINLLRHSGMYQCGSEVLAMCRFNPPSLIQESTILCNDAVCVCVWACVCGRVVCVYVCVMCLCVCMCV